MSVTPERARSDAAASGPSGEGMDAAAKAARKGPPPVHLWNPDYCGEMDLTIRADGTWIHEGTPIGRPALVRLFASILKREGDRFFLVTPVEKLGITVEDAPFRAVDMEPESEGLVFETDMGDVVTAGPDHAIRLEWSPDGEPAPYLHVRRGLEAKIDRKTFYRMVELGETMTVDGEDWFGVRSGGTFFPLIRQADLEAGQRD